MIHRQLAYHGHLTNPAMPESAVIIPPQLHHSVGHDRPPGAAALSPGGSHSGHTGEPAR
jgi:hypothetical protein